MGLAECGTHALTAAAVGACTTGETTLAWDLLPALGEGMLVLADRNFYGFDLWNAAGAGGAELLWRTKAGLALPPASGWRMARTWRDCGKEPAAACATQTSGCG